MKNPNILFLGSKKSFFNQAFSDTKTNRFLIDYNKYVQNAKRLNFAIVSLIFILGFTQTSISAQNTWTWMKGDNATNTAGVYGAQYNPPTANNPGGRMESVTWSDADGNHWLFGGSGYSVSTMGYLNDLWKFNISTNTWTFVKGDLISNLPGVYGTQGVAAPSNRPGARFGSATWIDGSGNLWLFGGNGYSSSSFGQLNDLWKYTPSTNNWTWMKGDNIINQTGVYGTRGIHAVTNKPGARSHGISWTDASGGMWMFGGNGYNASASGYLNDLWKYEPMSNEWTWMSGGSATNIYGTYGTSGVPSISNIPGSRSESISWIDASGKFWLFGGIGYSSSGSVGYLNDLWNYLPGTNEWTWVKGDITNNVIGVYGTQRIESPSNKPGARMRSTAWVDVTGNFWMFGGIGYPASGGGGYLNDLWCYKPSTNNWIWTKGDNTTNQYTNYGTMNVPSVTNKPGGREASSPWIDASGNIWLFGGSGYGASGGGFLNDLWKFDFTTGNWTWVHGNNTVSSFTTNNPIIPPSASNKPGSRQGGVTWTDVNGKLWLFGGNGIATSSSGYLNDLWMYDPVTNNWAWMKGDMQANQMANYGSLGSSASTNIPGARAACVSWKDLNGNLWIFGGSGYTASGSGLLNDLWKFNPNTNEWTWMNGTNGTNQNGIYGTKGIAHPSNRPGGRSDGITWTDTLGNLWLFAGQGYGVSGSGYLNDLWKYDPLTNLWTWISGYNMLNQSSTYGTKGVPHSSNMPGSRMYNTNGSIDRNGDLWFFGGQGYAGGSIGYLNDLWRYQINSNTWTWMSGDNSLNNFGIYGTIGMFSPANKPGSRGGAQGMFDIENNLLLFSGYGNAGSGYGTGFLNDLWKYNPGTNQWAWIKGDYMTNTTGIYGTQGVPSVSNYPSTRTRTQSWKDANGYFWIFGGSKVSGLLNDLWKYQGEDRITLNSQNGPTHICIDETASTTISMNIGVTVAGNYKVQVYEFAQIGLPGTNLVLDGTPVVMSAGATGNVSVTFDKWYLTNNGNPSYQGKAYYAYAVNASDPINKHVAGNNINIDFKAVSNAGTDQTICAGNTVTLAGSISGAASSSNWTSSGDGSFNNSSLLAAMYTPGSADIAAGEVTLTLTSNDPTGPCGAVSDAMIITINQAHADAGSDQFIQSSTASINISGSVSGYGISGITWTTNGTGSFANANSLTTSYSPSLADISAGSVILTLTTNDPDGPCSAVSDQMELTIFQGITINSQTGDRQICINEFSFGSINFNITAPVSGNYRIYVYEFGTLGAPGANLCYIGNTTNISAGLTGDVSIYYDRWYFTNFGNPSYQNKHYYVYVVNAADPTTIYVQGADLIIQPLPAPTLISSDADNIFCSGNSILFTATGGQNYNFKIDGISQQNGSSPTFTTNLLNTSGQVVSVLVTDTNTTCSNVSTGISNTILPLPAATITGGSTVCKNDPEPVITFTGSNGTAPYTFTWQVLPPPNELTTVSGNSAILNAPTNLPGTYNYYMSRVTDNNGCSSTMASVATVIVNDPALANAGNDQTVFINNPAVNLNGSISGTGVGSSIWSSTGTGVFNDATLLNAVYTPSSADILAGNVIITLTSNDPAGPCGPASDNMQVNIFSNTTINTQSGPANICLYETDHVTLTLNITASAAGNYKVQVYEFAPLGSIGSNLVLDGNEVAIGAGGTANISVEFDKWYLTNMGSPLYVNKHYYVYAVNSINPVTLHTQGTDIVIQPVPVLVINTTTTLVDPLGSNGGQLLCNGSVLFSNATSISSGSVTNYSWNFGDGSPIVNTTNNDILKHEFPVNNLINWFDPAFPNSRYTIEVTATSNQGCVASTSIIRDIKNGPEAVIGLTEPSTQNLSTNYFFFNNLSQNQHPSFITSSLWTWGDGTSSSNTTVIPKVYNSAGSFRVHLVTYTNTGCTDTTYMDLNVLPSEYASFTYIPNICSNRSVVFENTSILAGSYLWNFGDGNTSTSENPTHLYSSDGAYAVTLTINGSLVSDPQTIIVATTPLAGNITASISACNNTYTFSNISTGYHLTYAWTFTGGTGIESNSSSANRSYATAGTETVDLIITADGRCQVSASQYEFTSVIATSGGTTAAFTTSVLPGACNNGIQFTNTSSGSGNSYLWDFGDGTTATSIHPSKSYGYEGTYNVTLTAVNGICTSTASVQVNIPGTTGGPAASFYVVNQAYSQPLSSNKYDFFNTSQHLGFGWNTSYAWDFGDGTTNNVNTFVYDKTYAAAGTYIVTLTATSSLGCTSTATQTLTVLPSAMPGFTYTPNSCTNRSVSFNNTSVLANSYSWNFGDGSPLVTTENPSHEYTADGVYTVTLSINGSLNISHAVAVSTTPVAGFTYALGSCGNIYAFTNTSSGINLTYSWDFGDGATSTLSNPTHAYNNTQSRTATLTATTGNGCINMSSQTFTTVTGGGGPVASFTSEFVNTGLCNTGVNFTSTSSGANTYVWNYGDGTVSSVSSATTSFHSYAAIGTYAVTLTIYSAGGCSNTSAASPVVVNAVGHAVPITGFTTLNATQCVLGNKFDFFNTTTINGWGWVPVYYWDFGDGSPVNSNTFIYAKTFSAPGVYPVTLTATTNTGCTNTFTLNVTVVAASLCTPNLSANLNNENFSGVNKIENVNNEAGNTTGLIQNENSINMNLYPNPNNGAFKITLNGIKVKSGKIKILDILGRELLSTNLKPDENNSMEFSELNLAAGKYYLVLLSDNNTVTRKSFTIVK